MASVLTYLKELIFYSAGGVLVLVLSLFLSFDQAAGVTLGWLLAMLAAGGHFLIVWVSKECGHQVFMDRYYLGIAVRFLLILSLFTALILITNIELISFTLSFIISYIFYSVIEIILIHKAIIKKSP